MSLLLSPADAAAVKRKQAEQLAAAAIRNTAINAMSSDDFVTLAQAQLQLDQLHAYIDAKKAESEGYRIPHPLGWKICVLMLTIPEITDGGLHMIDEQREARAMASPQGIVLSIGDGCYQDPSRFAVNGKLEPWVRVGDRILWKKYDVTTFQLANGQRIGFMNDTQPFGVIDRGWAIKI